MFDQFICCCLLKSTNLLVSFLYTLYMRSYYFQINLELTSSHHNGMGQSPFTRYGIFTESIILCRIGATGLLCSHDSQVSPFSVVLPYSVVLSYTRSPMPSVFSLLLYQFSDKMDVNTFVIIYWYYRCHYKKQINRRYWLHSIIRERSRLELHQTLMCQLRGDQLKFFNYFRMSISTFDYLLKRVEKGVLRSTVESTILH